MPIYVPDYPHLDVAQVSLMASFDSRIASNQSIYHLFQRLLQLGRSMKLANVKKRGRWAYSGAAYELKLQCHDVGVFPEVKTCSRMSLYSSPERERKSRQNSLKVSFLGCLHCSPMTPPFNIYWSGRK